MPRPSLPRVVNVSKLRGFVLLLLTKLNILPVEVDATLTLIALPVVRPMADIEATEPVVKELACIARIAPPTVRLPVEVILNALPVVRPSARSENAFVLLRVFADIEA